MDVFSHGLWAGLVSKLINKKFPSQKTKFWPTFFWGMAPDVFAFALSFVWLFWSLIFSSRSFSDLPRPEAMEPASPDTLFIFRLTSVLYNISHSLLVFFLVFGVIFLVFKRPIWEILGWLLHILIDIPTHSYQFYPTPFLWPISGFKINGFSWANPWFLLIDYAAIFLAYYFLFRKKKL